MSNLERHRGEKVENAIATLALCGALLAVGHLYGIVAMALAWVASMAAATMGAIEIRRQKRLLRDYIEYLEQRLA